MFTRAQKFVRWLGSHSWVVLLVVLLVVLGTWGFIKLADETMRDIDIATTGKWAVGRDSRGYVKDYGRPEADVYRVNTATGERTLMFKKLLNPNGLGISPTGKEFVFWKDNKINLYDLDTAASRVLASGSARSATRGHSVSARWLHAVSVVSPVT